VFLEAAAPRVRCRTHGVTVAVRFAQRRVHQPWQPWRRPSRRCTSLLAGAMCVASRLKQAFEQASRDATRRGRSLIDPAGLLLGIGAARGGTHDPAPAPSRATEPAPGSAALSSQLCGRARRSDSSRMPSSA
jgi:hypothetical protein